MEIFMRLKQVLVLFSGSLMSASLVYGQAPVKKGNDAMGSSKLTDSLKMVALREIALRYPLLRQGGVSTEFVGNQDLKSDLYGNRVLESKVQISRIKAYVNIPVAEIGKNVISSSLGLVQQKISFSDINGQPDRIQGAKMVLKQNTFNFRLGITRASTLFDKPVVYSVSALAITNEHFSYVRMNYLGLAAITLNRSADRSSSVGLVLLLDPSSPLPVSPYFNAWRKFSSSLELFVDLPSRVNIRKQLSEKSFLSFGTELTGSLAFLNLNVPALPQQNVFTMLDLRTGPAYEYRLSKYVVLGASGGLLSPLQSRVFEKSARSKDYFIENKLKAAPYVNFSISVLPFIKAL